MHALFRNERMISWLIKKIGRGLDGDMQEVKYIKPETLRTEYRETRCYRDDFGQIKVIQPPAAPIWTRFRKRMVQFCAHNVAIGYKALSRLTTGNQNIAIGYNALANVSPGESIVPSKIWEHDDDEYDILDHYTSVGGVRRKDKSVRIRRTKSIGHE